ncbi:MAG: hypothetical protein EOO88_60410, partial [Pedobacter sp.]
MKLLVDVKVFLKRLLPMKLLLIMKLVAIFLLVASLSVNARGFGQGISISAQKITLQQVFKEVEKQSSYSFLWNENEFNKNIT